MFLTRTWVVKLKSKAGDAWEPVLKFWNVKSVPNLTLGVLTHITVRAKTKMTMV